GQVIMYADEVTPSMERALAETERRREKQLAHNAAHGIVPKTIVKDVRDVLEITSKADMDKKARSAEGRKLSREEKEKLVRQLTIEMKAAARLLEFEHAAYLRDEIEKLRAAK
ncbi:MAG: UvrB/UvrC motif-containing protein, partial [Oscillospiraceae bacterium]|nr:UvrB/UvrC motif-containing protein [Oscillospiraceae bacterium]